MNHTPGPWETSRDAVPDGWVQVTVYAEATGERVATAFERDANARLIAAAPDLLDALEQILIASEDNGDMDDIDWDAVRAALFKARGE